MDFPISITAGEERNTVYQLLQGQFLVRNERGGGNHPQDFPSDPEVELIKGWANPELEGAGMRWISTQPGADQRGAEALLPIYILDGAGIESAVAAQFDKLVLRIDPRQRPFVLQKLQGLGLARNEDKSRGLEPFEYFEATPDSPSARIETGLRAMQEMGRTLGVVSADYVWLSIPVFPPDSFFGAGTRASTCDQWYLDRIELPDPGMHPNARGVSSVIVAVIDRGAHSAKVAGIVKAVAPNCTILPVRCSNLEGVDLARCLRYAVEKGASVINISLSVGGPGDAVADLIGASSKAVICAASGNYFNNQIGNVDFPARHPSVIAVGSTDRDDLLVRRGNGNGWGSKFGPEMSVVAPGVSMGTVEPNGNNGCFNMTSSSSPVVAGVLALIRSVNQRLSPSEARKCLESTCYKNPAYVFRSPANRASSDGWCKEVGFGRVNATEAIRKACDWH